MHTTQLHMQSVSVPTEYVRPTHIQTHTLTGSAGSTLARTLPSLSVLTSSCCPVLLMQRVRDVTIDCRWPSSKLPSTVAGAAPAAASAAGAAPAAAGSTAAQSTSPNLSEKNTCWLSAEKVHAVAFLPLLLHSHKTSDSTAHHSIVSNKAEAGVSMLSAVPCQCSRPQQLTACTGKPSQRSSTHGWSCRRHRWPGTARLERKPGPSQGPHGRCCPAAPHQTCTRASRGQRV
jgi:hypothetical protein